jgi:hypothetical protein
MRPEYAKETNSSSCCQEAVNLASLPPPLAQPTLLFYTFGPTSEHLARMSRSCQTKEDLQQRLIAFFKPYYSRLPNFDDQNPEHTPVEALYTEWSNDEFAGNGSYCNFQIGLERGDEDVEVMRKGMPERGIWLAGEHTAPFVALGTVTGAYWSGESVAKRIVENVSKRLVSDEL